MNLGCLLLLLCALQCSCMTPSDMAMTSVWTALLEEVRICLHEQGVELDGVNLNTEAFLSTISDVT